MQLFNYIMRRCLILPILLLKQVAIGSIRLYQYVISPFLGRNCRYWPSCSQYTLQAIRTYGLFKGILLGCKRLLRCHPFTTSWGYDPLPETKKHKDKS